MRLVEPVRADVVVAGGSLGGLVAGAVLAHRGYDVVVVEETDHAGSRVGGRQVDGYWVDWGHRDGHGVGDTAFAPVFTRKAAAAAGVEVPIRPLVGSCLRVHWLPEAKTTELPVETVVGGHADPVAQLSRLCRCFELAPGREEEVARKTAELLGQLASIGDEEAWRLVPVRLEDWLARATDDLDVRRLVLQQNELGALTPNESLGRYVFHLRNFAQETAGAYLDHEAVGGVEGLVRAFADGLVRDGGRLMLGWKPLEITVEHNEVTGLVALDASSLVTVVEAPIVICDYPGSALARLVGRELLPAGFLEQSEQTEHYALELAAWWAGLSRLPHRRSDGSVEDFASPWHRILKGRGAVRRVFGGWLFPSAFSRRSAPPGRHLLFCWVDPVTEAGERGWRRFSEAEAALERAVEYLESYYVDLAECVEWSRVQYVGPPSWPSWYLKPIYRHPAKVATIDGLYMAGATTEATGGFLDLECSTGLQAAELAHAERGRLAASGAKAR
jgi:phytoene dehydrogenase-like protein